MSLDNAGWVDADYPGGGEQERWANSIKNIPARDGVRLDDLRACHVIFATCAACRTRTHIDARLLQHGRPPYTRLLDLERKLRCSSCGNHQGNTLSVVIAPRD